MPLEDNAMGAETAWFWKIAGLLLIPAALIELWSRPDRFMPMMDGLFDIFINEVIVVFALALVTGIIYVVAAILRFRKV